MPRLFGSQAKKIGLPPGTLVHVGDKPDREASIAILSYDASEYEEVEAATLAECPPMKGKRGVTWVDVDGAHDVSLVEQIGECYDIHPLTQEDILNTDQRPKTEDYGDYIYIVLKMLEYDDATEEVRAEQVSLVLGPDYVISFQETSGDVFDATRERIRAGKGSLRRMGADYLAYVLMDAIVDHYFLVLEKIGEKTELLEDELIADPVPEKLQTIHDLKREMIYLRKSVWPMREAVNRLDRAESTLITKDLSVYLRDLYDHIVQIIDMVETLRDTLSGMLDIYLSSVSNRMNEVMKVLTMIATIFIPLTLLAGVYGMNFKYMPELEWHWGYPLVWITMIIITTAMLAYFRRKRWL